MSDFTPTHKTVVIVAFLAALVGLAFTGRDTAALIAVGTAILGALGMTVAQAQNIKENTNGTMHKLLEMQKEQAAMLAKMTPAKDDDASRS